MNDQRSPFGYAAPAPILLDATERNRVLRNTYGLLAVSLIPTVLGAWIGVWSGILLRMSPITSLMVFLIGSFGLMFVINKNRNSATGVAALLGFTFFMGLMLSRLIAVVMGSHSNGGTLVMTAFGGTAAIFFGMATMATAIKRDLSGMGKFLMVGAWILFFAFLANFFLHSSALMLTLMVVCLGLFSAFLLYDIKRVIDGGETNYVMATLAIYLDLYNIFQSLLSLLGIFGGNND